MKKTSYEDIKNYVESAGYTLDITEEDFIKQNLKVIDKFPMICPKDHSIKMNFNNFKNHKRRCGVCSKYATKSYDYIKSNLEKIGYKLDIPEVDWNTGNYSTHSVIPMICPNEHKLIKSFHQAIRKDHTLHCWECHVLGHKKSYSHIKSKMEVDGYKLETTEYEYIDKKLNASSRFDIKCPDGHRYKVTYNNFVNINNRCRQCWLNTHRGENHHCYNPNKLILKELRKSKPSYKYIIKNFKQDKHYNKWILNPEGYEVDHKFPVKAFEIFVVENNLDENKKICMYLRENVVNERLNLQLMDKKRNGSKRSKYNRKKFNQYMKENGYLDEIERLKNEI